MQSTSQLSPAPSPDLLNRFVEYAQDTFIPALGEYYNATTHVGTVSIMPDEMMPEHVGAFYITAKPDGQLLRALVGGEVMPITAMYIAMSTAVTVAAVLEGRSKQLPPQIREQVLKQFKMELKFVVHEATHAVGADDVDAFQREGMLTQRAGLGSFHEAVTELSTQHNLNDIIRAAKLDKADPMLLQVDTPDTGSYVGMVDAAEVLVKGLTAMIPGASYDTELRSLVAQGSGYTGLTGLVGRALSARGVTDPQAVRAATRAVAGTLRQLDGLYKKTLSSFDEHTPRSSVRFAMDQLREQGAQVGRELVQDIESGALGRRGPSVAGRVPGRGPVVVRPGGGRSMSDLEDLISQIFGGREVRPVSDRDAVRGFIVLGD